MQEKNRYYPPESTFLVFIVLLVGHATFHFFFCFLLFASTSLAFENVRPNRTAKPIRFEQLGKYNCLADGRDTFVGGWQEIIGIRLRYPRARIAVLDAEGAAACCMRDTLETRALRVLDDKRTINRNYCSNPY